MNGFESTYTRNQTSFTPLVNKDRDYLLTIPYKGLSLTEPVRIFHIGRDYAVFQLPNSRVCAALKDRVYLRTPDSGKTIIASVEEVNFQRGWLTLCSFLPGRSEWRDRRSERVQTSLPVRVRLPCHHYEYYGTLDDLSIHGLGVLLYHVDDFKIPVEVGEKVHLEFKLPAVARPLRVDGTLIGMQSASKKLSRVGFHISPSRLHLNMLNKFIQQRRIELITELELIWMQTQEPRSSKDLYF